MCYMGWDRERGEESENVGTLERVQNLSPFLPFTPAIFGRVLNIERQVHSRQIVNWCLSNFMHMYVVINVREHFKVCFTRGKHSTHANHALRLHLLAHLYICSYEYAQTNLIRKGEQTKRWHDDKECDNSRLQRATRPFHGGALWGLKSLGKIQQMCDEERRRRETRRKGTLWLCSARMPTQTWAQSNQTKTVIEVLAHAQTKNIPRPGQGKRLTDRVTTQLRRICLWMLLDTFTLWRKVVFFSAVSWPT